MRKRSLYASAFFCIAIINYISVIKLKYTIEIW